MKNQYLLTLCMLLLLAPAALASCADPAWRHDPAVVAAQNVCQSQSGLDYNCIEHEAVTAFNPDICRLVGISIDDMCLQAVYEAANDPTICERIYLQGVVPNCRTYYAKLTPVATSPRETNNIPIQTRPPSATFPPPPSAIPTSPPTLTPSPTPLYTLDLSPYDPDIFPPIDIAHNPPLIARADETVELIFHTVNVLCMKLPVSCIPHGILHYTYGETGDFQTIPLAYEILEEMETLVARLPAADEEGESLRYYVEFSVPEAGYTQRYPGAGTIDLFTIDGFIPVELAVENAVKPGDIVYDFFWGYGPDKVRQGYYGEYLTRVGPPAMDVSDDGRIAILDPINERIVIFIPSESSYSSYLLPFATGYYSDLAFDQEGRLMVCDYQGEEVEETLGPDPYCYLLLPDGKLSESTPVSVRSPSKMTKDLKILDYSDSRLVAPFNSQGQANTREVQRQKQTWELPFLYPKGQDPFVAQYADVKEGLAFEVRSGSPLGVITEFAKTPQGYIMVFSLGDWMRAVWIDPSGLVKKDVTLPKGTYSDINFYGQVAVGQDGSLYAMGSTERGIEIHYVGAP